MAEATDEAKERVARIDWLCVMARAYAKRFRAHASSISLVPLWQAAFRLSAARLRATGEPGAEAWAARLEQLAVDENTKPGAWVPAPGDTDPPAP